MNEQFLTDQNINTVNKLREYILNSFKGLIFDETSHTYRYNNNKLISTSSFIKRYYKDFDVYLVSENKSKSVRKDSQDPRTGSYYRKRWEYIRDEAAKRGSRVHLYAECYPYLDEPSCDKERGVVEFYEWVKSNELSVLLLELQMYDSEYYKAGTTDGLLFNKNAKDIMMFDFKTNDSNLLKYGSKMLGKFNKYRDSKLNIYTLQASDYKYMFEKKTGLHIQKQYVVWLNNTQFTDKEDSYKEVYRGKYVRIFEVPDWSSIIKEDLKENGTDKPKRAHSIKKKIKSKIKPIKIKKNAK